MNDILKLILLIVLVIVLFVLLYLLQYKSIEDNNKEIEEEEKVIQEKQVEEKVIQEKQVEEKVIQEKKILPLIKPTEIKYYQPKYCKKKIIKNTNKKLDKDCLTKKEQTLFLNGLLDWGHDDYPLPEYIPKKLCNS